ncbi:hypothetical protein ACFQ7O_30640 [Streptomyces sp. NPDC056485]|uniref:hypothetical protein n=1 Tax=Streptomyces sp. NPDC056485 TaxID=3345834 RepID=UPI0036737EE2
MSNIIDGTSLKSSRFGVKAAGRTVRGVFRSAGSESERCIDVKELIVRSTASPSRLTPAHGPSGRALDAALQQDAGAASTGIRKAGEAAVAEERTAGACLAEYEHLLTEVADTGRSLNRDELQARVRAGARAAEAGHDLRSLVGVHLSAARTAWPATDTVADRPLAAVAQAIDAFAEGFADAQRSLVRQEGPERREFIEDLLGGRSGLGRLAERAERFGLRFSHRHTAWSLH